MRATEFAFPLSFTNKGNWNGRQTRQPIVRINWELTLLLRVSAPRSTISLALHDI